MRRRLLEGAGVALTVLGLAVSLPARDWSGWERGLDGHRERGMDLRLMALLESDRVREALALTDQQVGGLRQIILESEKSTVRTRADMALQGIELRELLRADKPDRDAVLKKVQQISDLRTEMMKQHVNALLAAKSILTPEQQRKIRNFMRSGRGGGFEGRRRWGPHGAGPGGAPTLPEKPGDPDGPGTE